MITLAACGALVGATMVGVSGPAGAQKTGGDIRFGLEADTTSFCIPNAQLVVSGIQIAAAVYDTLTAPNSKGEYVPDLAESVTPNANFTEWTIKLRPGITFHNGEALNADALKLNMDAWKRGPLFGLVYGNMGDVTKVDDLTVKVATKTPWTAFPAYLYLQGRAGIAAPAQINNTATCATNLIGTGPFKLNSPSDFKQGESLTVVKNPSYWKKDAKGKALPCLDKITFVPIPDSPTRENQLLGGQLDIMHTSSGPSLDTLKDTAGVDLIYDQKGNGETRYYLINTQKAPFNDRDARLALAYALNTKEVNQIRNRNVFTLAHSMMDRDSPGYVKNNGMPTYNLKKAKQLVQQVKAKNGGNFNVTFLTTDDSENAAEVQMLIEQVKKAGMTAELAQVQQAALVGNLLGGTFSVTLVRNFHSDPAFGDAANYVWWSQEPGKVNPINFGRINDPAVQAALDAGRVSSDPAALQKAYDDFNKAMAAGVYNIPAWYSIWGLASKGLTGKSGAPLPDGSKPMVINGGFPVDSLCKK